MKSDTQHPGAKEWVEFNEKYAAIWPNISESKPPLPEADEMANVPGKLEAFFSEAPAT